jgi:O-antigen ligase
MLHRNINKFCFKKRNAIYTFVSKILYYTLLGNYIKLYISGDNLYANIDICFYVYFVFQISLPGDYKAIKVKRRRSKSAEPS